MALDVTQRVPELFLPIKVRVGEDRRPGGFLPAGSVHALVLPLLADALAGRCGIQAGVQPPRFTRIPAP